MADTTIFSRVHHRSAARFVVQLLKSVGVSEKNAAITARGLVEADLRGVESHGINRIPSYLDRVRNGCSRAYCHPRDACCCPGTA